MWGRYTWPGASAHHRWSPGRGCRCTASASMLVARDRMAGAGSRGPGPPGCVEALGRVYLCEADEPDARECRENAAALADAELLVQDGAGEHDGGDRVERAEHGDGRGHADR